MVCKAFKFARYGPNTTYNKGLINFVLHFIDFFFLKLKKLFRIFLFPSFFFSDCK